MKKNNLTCIMFILPFFALLVVFYIIPLISAFYISLNDWDFLSPLTAKNFIGLDNYTDILSDSVFYNALFNTIRFSLFTCIGVITISFGLSLLFKNGFRGSGIYQMIIFSPYVTPTVALSMIWSWLYKPDDGLFNLVLKFFGLPSIAWLNDSKYAMTAIIIFTIWKSVGWYTIFFVGALEKVPQSVYEAADLDGAGFFTKLTKITLPLISPTTFFLVIVSIIDTIQVYDQISIMTGGGRNTTTLLFLYYQRAFQNFNVGYASSIAIIILVLIVGLSILTTQISKRTVVYN